MQARTLRIKIAFRKMEDLKPYAENAGTQSDTQIQQVAASIWQFNFVNLVLIDSEDYIVAGHGRVAPWHAFGPGSAIGCIVYPTCDVAESGMIQYKYGNRFSMGSRMER